VSSPAEAQPLTLWDRTKPWSFEGWETSDRLRALDPDTLADALRHVDGVDRDWRKPLPTRGFTSEVWTTLLYLEGANLSATEAEIARMTGCSRSAVTRAKRWLRSHRYLDWLHVRKRGQKWARCVYVTAGTRAWCERFLGSDALEVITYRSRGPRGSAEAISLARRAELLLEEALSRARVGTRNLTCWVMGEWLERIGVSYGDAMVTARRYAKRVPQSPRDRFTDAEAARCIRSAYKARLTLVLPMAESEPLPLAA
jgi:hypothetical protein